MLEGNRLISDMIIFGSYRFWVGDLKLDTAKVNENTGAIRMLGHSVLIDN